MTSRISLPAAAALAVLAAPLAGPGPSGAAVVEGYAWPSSVAQGETVGVYVSTDQPFYNLYVSREGGASVLYASYPSLPGTLQPAPENAFALGCDWSPSLRLPIPDSWPSGVYYVRISVPSVLTRYAIFTVRENQPGSTARILFQNSVTTWQAYNNWGGKSLYDYNSTGGERSFMVSFQRPYALYQGRGDFPRWEAKAAHWLELNGYALEYCTSTDTQLLQTLEDHYDVFISAGHDEYWSDPMRGNIEGRIARGGAVLFLGGNTCWWQIRYSGITDRIVCFKDKTLDPYYGLLNHLVTVNWHADPVFRPENAMTGVSFRNGGYVNAQGWYPASEGYGDYQVTAPEHWAYAGTGLQASEEFGWDETIVGFETDGALFTMVDGRPVPTGADGTPANFTILGLSPASYGHATMGVFTNPGLVFNVATTDWADALGLNPSVDRITRNVLDAMLAGPTAVAAGPAGEGGAAAGAPPGFSLAAVPSPARSPVTLRWAAPPGEATEVAIYSAGGRLVARLPLDSAAGYGHADWSARELGGAAAAPGVYHALLTGPRGRAAAKFVLLR